MDLELEAIRSLLFENYAEWQPHNIDNVITSELLNVQKHNNNNAICQMVVSGNQALAGSIICAKVTNSILRKVSLERRNISLQFNERLETKRKITACRVSKGNKLIAFRLDGHNNPFVTSVRGLASQIPLELAGCQKVSQSISWYRDEKLLTSNGPNCIIYEIGQKINTVKLPQCTREEVRCAQWMTDRQFVSATNVGSIYIWDLLVKRPVKKFTDAFGAVHTICCLEGGIVALADRTKTLKLWDIRKDSCFAYPKLDAQIKKITEIKQFGQGIALLVGLGDGRLSIWQQSPILQLPLHRNPIVDTSNMDGLYLTSEALSRKVCLWSLNRLLQYDDKPVSK